MDKIFYKLSILIFNNKMTSTILYKYIFVKNSYNNNDNNNKSNK